MSLQKKAKFTTIHVLSRLQMPDKFSLTLSYKAHNRENQLDPSLDRRLVLAIALRDIRMCHGLRSRGAHRLA